MLSLNLPVASRFYNAIIATIMCHNIVEAESNNRRCTAISADPASQSSLVCGISHQQ